MRRVTVLLTCLMLLAPAPAASAQDGRRDPFRPLVTEDSGGNLPVGTPQTDTGTTGTVDTSNTTEGTPNTGIPASNWAGLAYLLIILGSAAVVLARLRRPLPVTPRRR